MDMVILVLAVLGWIFTWKYGWRIMKWKNRKTALVMAVVLPYIGLLFALFLDQKCPHCRKYINMAADICPYCAKDIKTGKVATIAANKVLDSSAESEKKADVTESIPEAMSEASRADEVRKMKEQIKSLERREGVAICIFLVGALIVVAWFFYAGLWNGIRSIKIFLLILLLILWACQFVFRGGGFSNREVDEVDARKLQALKERLKEFEKFDGEVKNENT